MLKLILFPLISLSIALQSPPDVKIDKLWAEMSRTVKTGDFEGYAALYHDEAVLIDAISGTGHPISAALSEWKQGFEDTRSGRMKADVAFRFINRIHGDSAAHDTGIFRYTSQMQGEEPEPVYIHFQALFVRAQGEWKMMMEYQTAIATEEEWDAIE